MSFYQSPESVTRAVFQNWAYNLAQAAVVDSDVSLSEIDKSPAAVEKETTQVMENALVEMRVVEKLITDGKIQYKGDYKKAVRLILSSKEKFLSSSLWREIQRWYAKNVDRRGLRFTFKGEEIDRGNGVFSYGTKYLWSYSMRPGVITRWGKDLGSDKGMCWSRAFKDKERLREIMTQMQGR